MYKMYLFLKIVGVLSGLAGVFFFSGSKSAIHEIEGILMLMSMVLCFGFVHLSDRIEKKAFDIENALKKEN